MQKNQQLKGTFILILTSIVWGSGFIAQSAGREFIGPNTFNGLRMLIGSLFLLPFALKSDNPKSDIKTLLTVGTLAGIILCAASTIQTWGIAYTTAGNSGFITAMYMIFIPIIQIILGKKISPRVILCVLLAIVGMYFLCLYGKQLQINKGNVLTLVSALLFSIHILVIDKYINRIDAIKFSCIQFFICGVINVLIMFIIEQPTIEIIKNSAIPILYGGVFACGIGYTLQPIGQKYVKPTVASIIMSMESVFALIFGFAILGEIPSIPEIIGCVIMFLAIILIQLPEKTKENRV